MSRFFTTALVKAKLLNYGIFSLTTMPPDEWIDEVAITIEEKLELWLSRKLGVDSYTELYTSDTQGRVFLKNYPLISIEKVEQLLFLTIDSSSPSVPIPSSEYSAVAITDQRNAIWFASPEATFKISYTAGREEPFPGAINAMFAVFMELLKNVTPPGYPDWSFLHEPTRDYTSISLPGGLSKSYQLGSSSGTSGGIPGKGTIEDRLFAPLSRYRRLFVL